MVNYQESVDMGKKGEVIVCDWLKTLGYELTPYTDELSQLQKGDVKATNDMNSVNVEIKTDNTDYTNFFLETWSNKPVKRGWLYQLTECDYLCYYFIKREELYIMEMQYGLRQWYYERGHVYEKNEVKQKVCDQPNEAWGIPVPVKTIDEEVGYKFYRLNS